MRSADAAPRVRVLLAGRIFVTAALALVVLAAAALLWLRRRALASGLAALRARGRTEAPAAAQGDAAPPIPPRLPGGVNRGRLLTSPARGEGPAGGPT